MNVSKLSLFCSGIFLLVFLVQCDTAPLEPDDNILGFQFFPVEPGSFVEYAVEEINYSLSEAPEILDYQIREEIGEAFQDVEGREAFRLERFRREQANQAWALDSIWVIRRSTTQGIRVENNFTFVKLTFPPQEGNTWDGNAFNSLNAENYQISEFGLSFEVDTLNFPSTLRVVQNNECSVVSLDRRNEVFAEDVGLIYKEVWQLRLDPSGACLDTLVRYCDEELLNRLPSQPEPNCIEFGKILTQKIINYGQL